MREPIESALSAFWLIDGVKNELDCSISEFDCSGIGHSRPSELKSEWDVYIFFIEGQILRVGKTDQTTRFQYQHYGTRRAMSTLAKDIWVNRDYFGYNGEENFIGQWIFNNIGRANIRVPHSVDEYLVLLLEGYLHFRLRPMFEGRRK